MKCTLPILMLLLSPVALSGGERGMDPFPEVSGWSLAHDSTVYTPGTLWEYINGAAELFLSYDFQELRIAYYRASPDIEIRAEAYRHSSGENAYGIYSQERSPETAPASFGAEGYVEVGMLNFVAGPWYVKLSSNQSGQQTQAGLLVIAGAIDTALRESHRLPPGFDLLPVEQRVPRSEQYVTRDYLGYAFLAGAYLARYGSAGGCQVFVIPKQTDAAADSAYNAFLRVSMRVEREGHGPFVRIQDRYHGPVDLVLHGSRVAGILGCADPGPLRESLLKTIKK